MRETSRRYAEPYRPPSVAWVERGLAAWRGAPPPFTADALIARARRTTGLTRFDEEPLREPLERLCAALEGEAALTWTGRVLTEARLLGALRSRLGVQAAFERDPTLVDEPVSAPLFVTGLQRTGTTLLHRLLSVGSGRRALFSWEALDPVAPRGLDLRRMNAMAAERTLAFLAPDFFAVHPVEAAAPEEEVVLMDHSFISQVSEASYHVPSYAAWVQEQDHRPAYRYLRRCLQLLQRQRRSAPRRWVLKSPVHLEQLAALLEVFPDARIVQTHRDPSETVASFCSMVAHGRGVFSDQVDPREIGRHWLAKVKRMVERAMDAQASHPEAAFHDLRYEALIADPIGAVAEVCRFGGSPMGPDQRARAQRWLVANGQHKHGRHRYDAADFGLTPSVIDEAMVRYVERYAFRCDARVISS